MERDEFLKHYRALERGHISRRQFMKVTGLGTAAAVLAACAPTGSASSAPSAAPASSAPLAAPASSAPSAAPTSDPNADWTPPAGVDLLIDYRCTTAEELAATGERFDMVLAMEVVEHVTDVPLFIRGCATMTKPGGLMIVATINRTLKSFALAIVGAEYILRWLPVGTHRWDKFVTPNELEIAMEQCGLRVVADQGVIYNLFRDEWQPSNDTDVNYMLVAEKA